MRVSVDTEQLVRDIVALRRAERSCTDREPVAEVRDRLEAMLGRTVPRSVAARLLGISQTALDRWVERGEIATVLSPESRRVVPVRELATLLEALEQRRDEHPNEAYPLSALFQTRRERLAALEIRLPARLRDTTDQHGHRPAELRSLAYHHAVAERLNPEVVLDARNQLRRWRAQGTIDARHADRWERVLSRPVDRIAQAMTDDDVAGRELRQTSPFTAVLTEPERRRVLALAATK